MSEHFQFSIPQHVVFLDGYMDAVGRVLTTDTELWALTARGSMEDMSTGRTLVENWSKEFGSVVEDFLSLDQRARLGFYLIDYICWFKEFSQNAECFKLACEPLSSGTIDQAIYLLQLERNQRVLLIFHKIDKARRAASEVA